MLKTLKIAVNVAFVCAIIAYPFVLFWGESLVDSVDSAIDSAVISANLVADSANSAIDSANLTARFTNQNAIMLLAILCALSFIKYALNKDNLSLISGGFFGILIVAKVALGGRIAGILAYFYPTIINVAFLAFFALSLKGEAIITKIAKMQNPALDTNGVLYTRKLTKIWCALFAFNALVGFTLAFMEDKIYWSVFCGIVAYCLVGALFAVELLYRRFVLKRGLA